MAALFRAAAALPYFLYLGTHVYICYIFASPWMPEEHCVIGPPGAAAPPGLTPDFFLCLYSASAARLRQLEKSDIAMQT